VFRRFAQLAFRQLTTPAASIVFALILAACVWRVPSADVSTASIWGSSLPGWKVGTARRLGTISLYVIKQGDHMRVEDLDASTDALLAALRRDPDEIISARISYQRVARGWLDVVRFDDLYELDFRPVGQRNPTESEIAAARVAVLGWLESHDQGNKPRIAAALRDPTNAGREWNPFGVANTAAMTVSAAFLAISFAWIPRVVRERRTRRRAEAIAAGLCPRCQYAMGSIARCPECGEFVRSA
jgi:hypothetical protein